MRACVGVVAVYVVRIYSHSHLSAVTLHVDLLLVVLMLFQELNKHSYFVFSSHDGAHFIP